MAKIYDKAGEHTLILGVRESLMYPFEASEWLDLRCGFFLSLTKAANDNDITGLAEAIPEPIQTPQERYWIGFKNSNTHMPTTQGSTFIGFSNFLINLRGDSSLVSSDIDQGAGTDYWRPRNGLFSTVAALIIEDGEMRGPMATNSFPHFPQNAANPYATLIGLQMLRDTPNSSRITATIKAVTGAYSADLLFSSDPSNDVLLAGLDAWPTTVRTMGPVQLERVPDALFLYWPFHNSRLRLHSCGVFIAR